MPERAGPISIRAATVVAISALLLALLPATPAIAALCQLDSFNHHLNVTNQGTGIFLDNSGGNLRVNLVACAVIADLNTITIDMTGGDALTFSLAGGAFGPGFTDEGNGTSELEFTVVGVDAGVVVEVIGTDAPEGFTAGEFNHATLGLIRLLNLNALAELSPTPRDADVSIQGGIPGFLFFGGEAGDDLLAGSGIGTRTYPGPMILRGDAGADTQAGGSGPDALRVLLQDTADDVSGGDGEDQVVLEAQTGNSSNITLDDQPNDGTNCTMGACDDDNIHSDIELVFGSEADDTITGGPGSQWLSGSSGDDELYGLGGNDELYGSSGNDVVDGGSGNDLLIEAPDGDSFSGGLGLDTADFSDSQSGVTVTVDGLTNDGSAALDNVGVDVERVIGSEHDDELVGGSGNQRFTGLGGADVLEGRGGNDTLIGGIGADTLRGGSGADSLRGDPGPDVLSGGPGGDTVSYASATAKVTVSIDGGANDGALGEADNVKADVERVIGSGRADRFVGNGARNIFRGAAGNDVLRGFSGNDALYGEGGNDTFSGGPGKDLCSQGAGTGSKTACETG